MILIADSGSTKTQWMTSLDETHIIATKGFNPFFIDEKFVNTEIINSELYHIKDKVEKIIFFGAGCSSDDRNNFLKTILQSQFAHAKEIIIQHDILGAAIALFGNENGIASIIGTGSNSCVFQQGKIKKNVSGLGYILGDEGSGSYIGKEILKRFIFGLLPSIVHDYIKDELKTNKEEIFENVYKQPLANRYIASFAMVASKFQQEDMMQQIVRNGFEEFVTYHILCYDESQILPFGAVGSIACVFENQLKEVLDTHNIVLSKTIDTPVIALRNHYLNQK